jgi:uncharacterized RDD family membrane protein YckC
MTDEPGAGSPPPSSAVPPPPEPPAPQAQWQAPEQAPVSWQAPGSEPGPAPGVSFAPHGTRLVAYILDSCLITAIVLVLVVGVVLLLGATVALTGNESAASAVVVAITLIVGLIGFLISLAYFPWFWSRGGQTPGMRPFNLFVVRDTDGGQISGGQALLRLVGLWVGGAAFWLGYIWVFVDERRRGWHDLIAGTCVVERRR